MTTPDKMTDASAIEVLDSLLRKVSFGNSERAINNLPDHILMRNHIASRLSAAAVPDGDMWPTAELLCTPTGHYYWQTTFPVGDMPLGKYVLQVAAPTPEAGK